MPFYLIQYYNVINWNTFVKLDKYPASFYIMYLNFINWNSAVK